MSPVICPYCRLEIDNVSRDHIFPDFLGGTRTVPACSNCNNKIFGARFESKSARQLLSFQLMLSSLGISQIAVKEGTRWVRAYEHEGEFYDVEHRRGRPVLVLSKPKIKRDEQGRVISVVARSIDEARALSRRLNRGCEREFQEFSRSIPFEERNFAFEFGADFGRLAMKMCAALSTLMPSFSPDDIRPVVSVLMSEELRVDGTRKDFRAFSAIDNAVPLLSHAIYVERNVDGLHGLAVFFGAIRMYCRMASRTISGEPSALLGILDISTGKEQFSQIEPQTLTEAPLVISTQDHAHGIGAWVAKLQREISEAGPKGWSVVAQRPPRPTAVLWQSSTSDILSKSWSGSTLRGRLRPDPKRD